LFVQEANLGKVAKSCTAQIKGGIFKNKSKQIFPTFVQNTVLGLTEFLSVTLAGKWH